MRICPKCGFRESPCWKRSFQGNPNGDVDVARIDALADWEPDVAKEILDNRGVVVVDGVFAYLLGVRAVWVKRVEKALFLQGGVSIFKVPYESGKPKKGYREVLFY